MEAKNSLWNEFFNTNLLKQQNVWNNSKYFSWIYIMIHFTLQQAEAQGTRISIYKHMRNH